MNGDSIKLPAKNGAQGVEIEFNGSLECNVEH